MKTAFSFLFLCTSMIALAQKVDLDRYHFTVQYRSCPNIPLSKEYNTYSISLGGSKTSKYYIHEDDADRPITLHGWKKLSSGGHLLVRINLGDFIINSSTVTERKEEVKDKDGKVTSYRYYYTAKIVYNFPIRFSVTDYKGKELVVNEILVSSDKTWNSKEYGTYKEAADYYNNNSSIVRSSLARTELSQAYTLLSSNLNYKFGFAPANNYTKLWILNNKKHPEHEAMQAKWLQFKQIAARVTYETVSEEDKTALTSIIAYFDALKTKYTSSEKADKKMRYAAYFNNAMIYMWFLNNFDAAIKEADDLVANEFDESDGKDLRKDAEKLKDALKKNNLTSLRYAINLDNANGPK